VVGRVSTHPVALIEVNVKMTGFVVELKWRMMDLFITVSIADLPQVGLRVSY
jgi:hypothetical protein